METMATDNLYPSPVKDVILETPTQKFKDHEEVFWFLTWEPFQHKPYFNTFSTKKLAEEVKDCWKEKKVSSFPTNFISEEIGSGKHNDPSAFIKVMTVREILNRSNWLGFDLDKKIFFLNL